MRLDVRPKRDAGRRDLLGEALRVALDDVEVDHQRGGIQAVGQWRRDRTRQGHVNEGITAA